MKNLAQENYEVVREVVSRTKATKTFKDRKEDYKLDIIKKFLMMKLLLLSP